MQTEAYNGQYEQCLEVIIDADTHDLCNMIAKRIRYLCMAWIHNVRYDEHKSARKGDVLHRSIMIYQTAYADDIISFREALRCICFHYHVYCSKTAKVSHTCRSIEPKDSRRSLLK